MASQDAQKSEVHSATEDATASPTNRTVSPPGAADRDTDTARGSPDAKPPALRPGEAGASAEKAEPLDPGPAGPDESDYGGPVVIQTDMDLGKSAKPKG